MPYQILIKHSAERELNQLNSSLFKKICAAILLLEHNPRPTGCKKLRSTKNYRIWIGDNRILYSINDENYTIEIISVAHRRDAYR